MFPHDPLLRPHPHLLVNMRQAAAWHQAVLANSPIAYKNFFDTPRRQPLRQGRAASAIRAERPSADAGRPPLQGQWRHEPDAAVRHGKNRRRCRRTASTRRRNRQDREPAGAATRQTTSSRCDHTIKPTGNNLKNAGNNFKNNDLGNKPKFERRQFNSGNRFSNSQARMGNGMRMGGMGMGGGGMRMMGGGGGMRFGGMGRGGFGRH